jgi:hypothetical protein
MHCAVLAPILVVLGTVAAAAQSNSRKLVTTDLFGQYALMKTIIESRRDIYSGYVDPKEKRYNLADCGVQALSLGVSEATDDTTSALSMIAAHYYMWVTDLPSVGYPRESVVPLIQDWEKSLLEYVKRTNTLTYDTVHREGERLAKEINDLRSHQHLGAKQVEYMDECGGHGTDVTFVIPTDAHMFMTSTFFFELCQKQGINPSDRGACNRYVEVPNGTKDQYAGLFVYVGEWDDGYTRTGQIDVERLGRERGETIFRLRR